MGDLREALDPCSATLEPADSETRSRAGSFGDVNIHDDDFAISDDDIVISDDDITNPDTRVPKSMSTGSYIPPSSVPAMGLPPLRSSSPWQGPSKIAAIPAVMGPPIAYGSGGREPGSQAATRDTKPSPPKQHRRCPPKCQCLPRSTSKRRKCCAIACCVIGLLAAGAAVAAVLRLKPW